MLKFRCSICDKKIGVPDEYAGKKVKCPQCTNPVVVPEPEPQAQPDLPVDSAPDSIWTDDLLAPPEPDPGQYYPTDENTCPQCNASMALDDNSCPDCGYTPVPISTGGSRAIESSTTGARTGQLASQAAAGAKVVPRFPIAVAAGFVSAIIGSVIWAGIVYYIDYEIGFVAWAIGVLIGFVMAVIANEKSIMLGIIASLFAIISIVGGKYFIAKWYVMPLLEEEFSALLEVPLDETIQNWVNDPDLMFQAICHHLAGQGEFDDEFAEKVMSVYEGDDPDPDLKEKILAAHDRILELRDSYSHTRKEDIARQQIAETTELIKNALIHNISLRDAFFATFSFFDIFWIILAISSAYRIASS